MLVYQRVSLLQLGYNPLTSRGMSHQALRKMTKHSISIEGIFDPSPLRTKNPVADVFSHLENMSSVWVGYENLGREPLKWPYPLVFQDSFGTSPCFIVESSN